MTSSFAYLRSATLWAFWALPMLTPAFSQEANELQTCQAVVVGLEKRPKLLLSETVNQVATKQASEKVIEFLRSNAQP